MKQVPDTTEIKLDPVKGTLIRDGVPNIMNPDDKGVLEQAPFFKNQFGAEVSVITMGPSQATAILYEAFVMGCDRGYLITDRRFGGADILATSCTISQALKTADYDIVLVGRQATDGNTTQVRPQTVKQLNLPQVTYVEHVDHDGKRTLAVVHNVEGKHETLEVDTPYMLTFLALAYEPHYMNVSDVMAAFDKEIITLIADSFPVEEEHLGLKGSPTRVKKPLTGGAKVMDTLYEDMISEEVTDSITEKLKEKFII